jgi:hypothetical protein
MHGDLGSPPGLNRWMKLTLWRTEHARLENLLTTTSSNEDIKHRQKTASGHAFDAQTNS